MRIILNKKISLRLKVSVGFDGPQPDLLSAEKEVREEPAETSTI